MNAQLLAPLFSILSTVSGAQASIAETTPLSDMMRIYGGQVTSVNVAPKNAANDLEEKTIKKHNAAAYFFSNSQEMLHDNVVAPPLKKPVQPLSQFKTTLFGMVKAGAVTLFGANANLGQAKAKQTTPDYGPNVVMFRPRKELGLA